MISVLARGRVCVPALLFSALLGARAAGAATDSAAPHDTIRDSLAIPANPHKYEVLVSATRTRKDAIEVPNATAVVRGDELRRRGTRTLAQALQDVVGLDTGDGGSDNGMHLPNIGMWGLKEFDALLITVDGVPVGGPFNPELEQIPVEDIDRIEIVKGPQGTLYGVSAFAGMIQVFTRSSESGRGHLTLGGGSFDDKFGDAAVQQRFGAWTVRLAGALQRSDGWQDRTGSDVDRGGLTLDGIAAGRLAVTLDLAGLRDTQRWGSPLPLDPHTGEIDPNVERDRNVAIRGARLDHHVWSMTARLAHPLWWGMRAENTLGVSRDQQISVRSFPEPDAVANPGDPLPSAGVAIRPEQNTLYEDLRLVSRFDVQGPHELVVGGAVTHGKVTAEGEGFDFDQTVGDPSSIPDLGDVPAGDLRSFSDRRTFVGIYAHDEWTPVHALTLSGGGRWDRASETLHTQAQEQGPPLGPLELADDARITKAWSGDIAALVRLLPQDAKGPLGVANLYANWKSSFKPAAPNLTEAEGAEILDPERTHSVEAGLKTRAFGDQVSFDASWFDMTFDNLVVPILDQNDEPALTNAGKERFKGVELSTTLAPTVVPGASLSLGYAHHDPRFVDFVFLNPDGELEDDSGLFVELAPRELFNARLAYRAPMGVGAFGTVRYQGRRALDRDNLYFLPSNSEWDAGAFYDVSNVRVSVTGHNLGDSRHVVAESDIGDAMFYLAPPRRFTAEASYRF